MAWALTLLALAWLGTFAWRLSITYWYLVLPALAVTAFGADRYWRSLWAAEQERRRRVASYSLTFEQMRDMHWRDFEVAVMYLMRCDGIDAEHTGKTGDFSGDVTGYDPALDERWMVQVKHYNPNNRVRSDDVQKVSGAAWPIYQARMKLVVTTSGYTRDARAFSAKAGVHLIDKTALIRWATDGVHLHEVLGITADSP
ncbi:restriction endonuclease [Actinomadura violacea]|uniref:Restriction endonuclease n=1 Tax=Actinomadura violacea TaxID=2819934 RepID=A0ABS3S3L6_9ACTN|nr:restriction endonuclease [Actinomadura violacea]MBO2463491.1 restriction endonuclease [Actinomadura violacea]